MMNLHITMTIQTWNKINLYKTCN